MFLSEVIGWGVAGCGPGPSPVQDGSLPSKPDGPHVTSMSLIMGTEELQGLSSP